MPDHSSKKSAVWCVKNVVVIPKWNIAQSKVGKMVPNYNHCSIRFKLLPHWNCNLACKLAHSSWRRRVPVWLRRNLHYSNLCARTHLSLWPGGSHRQQPRGHLCLCVHGCVCMCVCVCVCVWQCVHLCLWSCGYSRKWCSGLSGHGSRSLGLSTVISSRMVITYCKNKHRYHLVLPLCTVTYTPRKALDHQNTQDREQ